MPAGDDGLPPPGFVFADGDTVLADGETEDNVDVDGEDADCDAGHESRTGGTAGNS